MTTTNTNDTANTTTVRRVWLDDGTQALAARDPRDGTWSTRQRNLTTGGWRIDTGWRDAQLRDVSADEPLGRHLI